MKEDLFGFGRGGRGGVGRMRRVMGGVLGGGGGEVGCG